MRFTGGLAQAGGAEGEKQSAQKEYGKNQRGQALQKCGCMGALPVMLLRAQQETWAIGGNWKKHAYCAA